MIFPIEKKCENCEKYPTCLDAPDYKLCGEYSNHEFNRVEQAIKLLADVGWLNYYKEEILRSDR